MGDTTTITGPSFKSGVIARIVALTELSRMMLTPFSICRRAHVTALSGEPWSSHISRSICRPLMPPAALTVCAHSWRPEVLCAPTTAIGPVNGEMTPTRSTSAAKALVSTRTAKRQLKQKRPRMHCSFMEIPRSSRKVLLVPNVNAHGCPPQSPSSRHLDQAEGLAPSRSLTFCGRLRSDRNGHRRVLAVGVHKIDPLKRDTK